MGIWGNVLVKVIVLEIANLAVSVVNLRSWHRDVISFVSENAVNFRSLLYSCYISSLFVMPFNCRKPLLSKDTLVQGLARIHASRSMRNKLMNVKLCSRRYQIRSLFSCFLRNRVKLMIHLLLVLGQLLMVLWLLHPWNPRAVEFLLKFDFGENKMLVLVVSDSRILIMEGHWSEMMVLDSGGEHKLNSVVEVLHINNSTEPFGIFWVNFWII